MPTIKVLTSNSYTDYSYQINNTKIFNELCIYRNHLLDNRSSDNVDSIEVPTYLQSHLPNFSRYSDITSLNNFPVLSKLLLTQSFNTSFSSLSSLYVKTNTFREPKDLYPIAVRYIDSSGGHYIERPPFQIEVNFNRSRSTSSNGFPPLKIWVPWTLSYYHPHDSSTFFLYFSNKSLSSFKDKYLPSFLPNTYDDGRICFGQSSYLLPTDDNSTFNIKLMYQAMFNEYMSGGWNTDLNPKHVRYIDSILDSDQQKYPTLYLFSNPTFDYFKKHYPKMRTSTINSMIKHVNYNRSYFKDFKYFFFMMNTFDLETTLKFYSEIFEYNTSKNIVYDTYVKSFEEIVEKKSTSDYNSPNTIFSNLTPSLSRFLVEQDPFVDLLPSSEPTRLYFIFERQYIPHYHTENPPVMPPKLLHKLTAEAIDNKAADVKKIYYINKDYTDVEKVEFIDPSVKFGDYYLNLLRMLNPSPISLE